MIKIKNRVISNNSDHIIPEIGINHNGNLGLAFKKLMLQKGLEQKLLNIKHML